MNPYAKETLEAVTMATAALTERSGATEFDVCLADEDEGGWYCTVRWRGARLDSPVCPTPETAAFALALRMLEGATCRCGKRVTIAASGPSRCGWTLGAGRWSPGCDAPAVRVDGGRGDTGALNRAMRRAQRKRS